jgi:hypothetical protein
MVSPRKNHPCLCNVRSDLGFERIGIGKRHFFAQEGEVGDFEVLAVKVAVEIEEMDFEGVEAIGGEGGAPAEVEDGLMEGVVFADLNAGGVDAAGGKELLNVGEVGGGKAEEPSALVARDDGSGDGVGAAKEPGGIGEEPLQDRGANAGAADGLAIEFDGRDDFDGDVVGAGKFGETGGVAFAVAAKGPIPADGDVPEIGKDAGDFADELRGGEAAQVVVEFHRDDGDGAKTAQQDELLAERGETGRNAVGGDDGKGMRLEGEGRAVFVKTAKDGLMAEVNAVENADSEAGDAGVRRQLREGFGAGEHSGILLAPQA